MEIGEFNLVPNEKFWIRESKIPIGENFESLAQSADYLVIIARMFALRFNGVEDTHMSNQYLMERFRDGLAKFFVYLSVTCEKLNVSKIDSTVDILNDVDHTIQNVVDTYFKYAEEHDKEHPLPEKPIYPELEHLSEDIK